MKKYLQKCILEHELKVVKLKTQSMLKSVEGHLWKAQWKEKPNDEGHKKLTMNSYKRPLGPSGRNNESLAQQRIHGS